MKAKVVIGAAFGDEGKGLMVDYFCRQVEKPIVVRFNGGAQAGHTVVTPDGLRHVFHHYGSGLFAGAETYLGPRFLVNPFAWAKEMDELGSNPNFGQADAELFVHPEAPVTTIYDMFINQKLEESRTNRHGSCGMGVHETMLRQEEGRWLHELKAGHLFGSWFSLPERLSNIQDYAAGRLAALGLDTKDNLNWIYDCGFRRVFLEQCEVFAQVAKLMRPEDLHGRNVIFEGAQGLLLDEKSTRFFPHVTHSRTGLANVMEIIGEAGFPPDLDVYYVVRSYLTRHGAGELPGENADLWYEDNTNVHNDFQHSLRFAPMDYDLINNAIQRDIDYNYPWDIKPRMAVTHADQCIPIREKFQFPVAYESYGPTHQDVKMVLAEA